MAFKSIAGSHNDTEGLCQVTGHAEQDVPALVPRQPPRQRVYKL